MSHRWIWSAFPELLRLESTTERVSVWRHAYSEIQAKFEV